jgi:hypothetical protein
LLRVQACLCPTGACPGCRVECPDYHPAFPVFHPAWTDRWLSLPPLEKTLLIRWVQNLLLTWYVKFFLVFLSKYWFYVPQLFRF